jgi:transcriptional antiterminator
MICLYINTIQQKTNENIAFRYLLTNIIDCHHFITDTSIIICFSEILLHPDELISFIAAVKTRPRVV